MTTFTDQARTRVRDPHDVNSAQRLMIVILAMTTFGVSDIVADLLPRFSIGDFEVEIAYFAFIPVVLAALLSPLWVALGAAIGEALIADLLLGSFGGFGELEGFLQILVGTYVAGCLVKDPRNVRQLCTAGVVLVTIDKLTSGVIDMVKVVAGIDPDTLADSGTVPAVLLAESLEFAMALLITGVLFGGVAAAALAPRLYGKLEPIMGLRPRTPATAPRLVGPWGVPFVLVFLLGLAGAVGVGVLSQWEEFVGREEGVSAFGSFDAELLDTYGSSFVWVGAVVGLVAGIAVVVALAAAVKRRA